MIKINNDKWPEKRADFTVAEIDNKMVNIMLEKKVVVKKGHKLHIGVRFKAGDDFFC